MLREHLSCVRGNCALNVNDYMLTVKGATAQGLGQLYPMITCHVIYIYYKSMSSFYKFTLLLLCFI